MTERTMHSGEEIQAALRPFVTRWQSYEGTERAEAQTFLNELFTCYGTERRDVAEFEKAKISLGFMDLLWPDVCIVEMKAPKEADTLEKHRPQVFTYWQNSADPETGRAAPPYFVLCAFRRFEVWEPGKFPTAPLASFTLDELPDRYETLLFLTGSEEPLFATTHRELTTEAAQVVTHLYQELLAREAAAPETLSRFLLQIVWCLFAEDLGMLDGYPVQRIVETLVQHPDRSSYGELGTLFELLNDESDYGRHGVYQGTRYVNGQLFASPAKVHLELTELLLLRKAAQFDWRNVDPTIFGSLMEGALGREQRWKLGAHYTHEADIMKIIRPTIVEPWRARIASTSTPAEARDLLEVLCSFKVLDPACGCGNFLYLAYRELRTLESELKARITSLAASTGQPVPAGPLPFYPLRNIQGLDIEPVTTAIARVTLWMGHRQMTDRFGPAEPVLPLVDLSGIQTGDALSMPWPETDCIVGNPPFLGSQHLRGARGDIYIDWLKKTFKVGVKDYCVYWFRRAHDHLKPGQRAGLVGTNSISQNRARSASLDYIVVNGGVITDAVSSQKWPGEAKVHVSLANWVKQPTQPPSSFTLDGADVSGITPELRTPERSTGEVARLAANKGQCFQGPIPVGDGFILKEEEAEALLARTDASYRDVVRPYLTSDDMAAEPGQRPGRWVIDFGERLLESAMQFPAALDILRERVKPDRKKNNDKRFREKWWLFGRPRVEWRREAVGLGRYVAGTRHGKRLFLAWSDAWTMASDATNVFAFDDDYSMGVLSSAAHGAWAWSRSSTLETRLRYTPSTVFETFPWPYPFTDEQRERVAEASRRVIARRQEICLENNCGLTKLYNLVDDGAYADLKALHRELDEAVAWAYGWEKSIAQDSDELVRRLLALNREITAGKRPYDPFGTAPKAVADTLDLQP